MTEFIDGVVDDLDKTMIPEMDPPAVTQPVPIQLHRLDLRFRDTDRPLERPFREKYFQDNLKHLRYCHFYSIAFYLMAAWIDYVVFPHNVRMLLGIRLLIVTPVFIVGYLFTYTPFYKRFWQEISFCYILITGGSFILFTAIAPAPAAYDYYVGILFSMMFGYTLIRERFIHASAAGLILVAGYAVSSVLLVKMPANFLFLSNFFLVCANFLGMLIARHLEISARRDFYLEHRLFEEQQKVRALNDQLERKVAERTRDLAMTNDMLNEKINALKTSEADRSKLEVQLRQAYKMEAIGTLAGGIAHDFNNILASVIGYTELSLAEAPDGSALQQNLRGISAAGNRAKELVRQILAFARQTEEEPKPILLDEIAREVVKLLRSLIPSNIEIRADIQSRCHVIGDPINMHQVLMNLSTNAGHAMDDLDGGGVLEIRTADIRLSESLPAVGTRLPPGNYVTGSVSDTGSGIPADIVDSIFEPFFTTKDVDKGTGMGLAMVYGIIKKYHGGITVDSEPGKGTVFTFYLPAAKGSKDVAVELPGALPLGDERILVVDDEPSIARIVSHNLSRQGYSVTVRTDSTEALHLFQSDPEAFDLVISDMTMPKMTGDRLAGEMIRIRPDLPIILCTGYSGKITEETARQIGIREMIFKPVSKATLIKSVRRVLDER